MAAIEWNKKEELVSEQALKHLKVGAVRLNIIPLVHTKFVIFFVLIELHYPSGSIFH